LVGDELVVPRRSEINIRALIDTSSRRNYGPNPR
jgi:hypothetical protein